MERAAIYARTSSYKQKFGYSLDEQVRLCVERCHRQGWDPVFVFRDEAENGKDIERPKFQSMMTQAERGLFDVVVIWKLDRFSRSLLHAVQVEAELRELDVALHSITEQIDTTTSAGRFNFRSIASAAEFERDMISERTQMGLKALALEHRWPNDHPPLGFQKASDGTLEVDGEEANLVNEICHRYVELRSMPQLAHELNQEGVTTKTGGEWTAKAISDVLRNELYIGMYSVGGFTEYVEDYRIVEDDVFASVTEVRNRFRTRADNRESPAQNDWKAISIDAMTTDYCGYVDETGKS
ncbi:recombinase family protein [Halomicrococcus sp. NG-SE-24]|uniref:recombinase family protein n=1 Tax=Halomicrococcus sp. NG-SE-24 TaxID=3436928 RepID=UPI003D988D6D